MIFLDTSAIFALADANDPNHSSAVELFHEAFEAEDIFTHSYVLVEAAALLQRRLSLAAALRFLQESESFLIHWVGAEVQRQAFELLEDRGRRGLSLVDCVSFVVMRLHGAHEALAFDLDFEREGFTPYRGSGQ